MANSLFIKHGWNFTDEDKHKCLALAKKMVRLSMDARRVGLPSLERTIENEDNLVLGIGIPLAANNTDPVLLERILQNFIVSSRYRGEALLKAIISMEGVLAIASGENPLILETRLGAMLYQRDPANNPDETL